MEQKSKTLQDIFRERRMKDMKRQNFFYRLDQFWTAAKRLVLVGLIGYGTYWGSKPENRQSVKSFLKSHSAPIEEVGRNFNEGVGMIKDTFKKDKNSEAYHEQRRKHIEGYRKMGIDPVVKYAEAGTKEYREELDYYRKNGVFSAQEDASSNDQVLNRNRKRAGR